MSTAWSTWLFNPLDQPLCFYTILNYYFTTGNTGLAVGLSVGVVGITIVLIILTAVCVIIGNKCIGFKYTTTRTAVALHRPRLRYTTSMVPTTQLSTTNEAISNNHSSSVALPLDNIQSEFELQPAYKDAEFSSQDAPPSYTAAKDFPTYEPPSLPQVYICCSYLLLIELACSICNTYTFFSIMFPSINLIQLQCT